ncbi:MAG: glycoside hydrolase family 99-like domain-containing protein [Polyangia bacterium]
MKLVAHYFPQLHRIPENDAWWGDGFTDWTNVRRAKPMYAGHQQPRVPVGGYYDQSDLAIVTRQVEQAREHGLTGFCHYHYWFDGKQLLERPTDLFLDHPELDLGICLAWANETWSRRWDGQDHLVLIEQTHPPDRRRWALHFDYLQRAFTDRRAITVDGKPVFVIYRPQKIVELAQMLDYFRERAHALGLPGLYLVAMDQSREGDDEVHRHFDAQIRFEPFSTFYQLRERDRPTLRKAVKAVRAALPTAGVNLVQRALDALDDVIGGPTRLDYARVWEEIVARPLPTDRVVFPGAFVDWDNTARYKRHATIFEGATPAIFERGLARLVERARAHEPDEQLVFINAWNEWAEGCYLEPDETWGNAYLEAVRRVSGR